MKHYRKLLEDGTYSYYEGDYIKIGNAVICNPTGDILIENGYEEYTPEPVPRQPNLKPTESEIIKSLKALVEPQIASLSDEDADKVMAIFPTWVSKIGQQLNVGDRVYYDSCLFKVIQAHTAQLEWAPDVATSLFTNVTSDLKNQSGTIDNPIEWMSGMECFAGKYYFENGYVYICTRDSGTALYYNISDLIGTYFNAI